MTEPGRPYEKSTAKIYKPSFLDELEMKRCMERELEDISQAFSKLLKRIEVLETKKGVTNG